MQGIANPNLYLYKVCHVNFNQSQALCDHHINSNRTAGHGQNISSRNELDNAVQAYVTNLEIYMTYITSIPSILCVLFLGPW